MTLFTQHHADKKQPPGRQTTQSAPISEEEQFARTDSVPDLRQVHADPRMLSPSAIIQLQRTLGNQTVQRLLVNRQEVPVADPPSTAPDSDLSDDDVAALFEDFMPDVPRPEVPSYEVIAGSTGAEFSRGELENQVEARWERQQLRFTESARQLAGRPPTSTAQAIPTQSPNLPVTSGQQYAHRWALAFFAWDYQRSQDLTTPSDDVSAMMQEGSPFRSALDGEFSNTIEVANPSGAAIVDRINAAISQLILGQLLPGEIAELVITFSGHGNGGGMVGVDEETVAPSQLREIAEQAQQNGIHIIYVMDICFAGHSVNMAQYAANSDVSDRVNELPREQARELRTALGVASILQMESLSVNDAAERLAVTNRNQGTPAASFQANVIPLIQPLVAALNSFGEGANVPSMAEVLSTEQLLNLRLHHVITEIFSQPNLLTNRQAVIDNLRSVATLLDRTNDIINAIIEDVNARVTAASAGDQQDGASPQP